MAGYEDNPFADPTEAVNPFADPSVTEATSSAAQGIEDFNPFAEDTSSAPTTTSVKDTKPEPPPVIKPTPPEPIRPPDPPAYSFDDNYPGDDDTAPIVRKDELAKTQKKEISQQQQQQVVAERINNFPPLPGCMPCKPCFYHNISVDIPPHNKSKVKAMWLLWWLLVSSWLLNTIAGLAALIGLNSDDDTGKSFGLSLAFLIFFVPCSFLCWYWPLYKAFRSDSSMWFMWFFMVFFFQIVSFIVNAIGIQGSGSIGFIIALQAMGKNKGVGAICLFVAAFWIVASVLSIVFLIRIHRYYRSSGLTVEQAQKEFANSRAARQATSSAGQAVVAAAVAPQQ
eukprot:m.307551 g.307551  ORF g.307551 m.307551 type:complete len:339 (+) comp42444_c0_seq1:161-1177(+)